MQGEWRGTFIPQFASNAASGARKDWTSSANKALLRQTRGAERLLLLDPADPGLLRGRVSDGEGRRETQEESMAKGRALSSRPPAGCRIRRAPR